jgi:hypothetical protein
MDCRKFMGGRIVREYGWKDISAEEKIITECPQK